MKGIIYKYTSPSGKSYIGQTIQTKEQRERHGKGYERCPVFYKAIQKYGIENFTYEILEEVEQEKLDEREIYYISLYDTLVPNGYNVSTGGLQGCVPESCKKTLQFDLCGNLIKEWSSLSEAVRFYNMNKGNIAACCRHEKRTAEGYIWQYADDVQLEFHIEDQRTYSAIRQGTRIPVLQFTLDGELVREYESISQAYEITKIRHIGESLRHPESRHTCGGYIWKFKNPEQAKLAPNKKARPVNQYSENLDFIASFPSVSAAARGIDISASVIGRACKKHVRGGGYYWRYADEDDIIKQPTEAH